MTYKKLKPGSKIPQALIDFIEEPKQKWQDYPYEICEAYYKGDPETSKDWIAVTDDGGFYKVGAEFMVWHRLESGEVVAKANWSYSALKRTINSLKKGEKAPFDPNYQS